MGSSKKKKEGERIKKHRRDRKDTDSSKKSRDKSKRRREDDDEELLDYALHDAVQVQQNVYDYGHGFLSKVENEEKSTKDETSLSIEETNKIREKLGLKPLAVPDTNSDKTNTLKDEEEFVHAPPVNIAEQESQEKYKEKLKEIREKRDMQKKLGKVKKLADSESDNEDSALSWVKKVRKKENEKQLAIKRAQLLEEMDEEFGVGELVMNVMGNKEKAYTAKDLKGLTVEHSSKMIKEGKEVILTLKDSGILENEDDVLVNVNLIDTEKAEKNIELRKKKPGYQAYDEFDEDGEQKVHGLLSKYDEEIDGVQKKTFNLGKDGGLNLTKEQEQQKIREQLKNEAVSLTMPQLQTQSEYYTEKEMLKFKKPKKRRKIKKREALKADDLLPLGSADKSDHGSRNSRPAPLKNSKSHIIQDDAMEWQMADPDDAAIQGRDMNEQDQLVDDEDDQLELQLALTRSRRSKIKKENVGAEKVVESLTSLSNNMDTKSSNQSTIVLDSTSEFCRTLGEIPTYGASGNRADLDDIDDEMDLEEAVDKPGGWEAVKQQDSKQSGLDDASLSKDTNILDDEPTLGLGIGAALMLVQKKGLIECDKKERKLAGGLALPETVKVIDEEKMRDEERERLRERGRDRDRERYNPNSFKEKVGYKPDVKLEYVDEQGRQMNPKEAFRYLSHKFHGKTPGKLKSEKRQKKFAEDLALKKMNAGDTPLNTVALFSEKQKQGQTPYLILSGGGQTFSAGPTIQKGK
ncbi:U4/U6.U5 tri-snRNP-associated protein 1-like [Dendronephthya gigantea]|uniref:U4/U6.U5 tri-snRNP-associated protein 1-like n=1 Tax=Dendronephthya gigantea TaxID=151771 RepID=UPI00106C11EF|nr:U4/U6.U5 tri-snRNP-associated protein 1-like [Dendronephthya gigantea]